jgi:glycosyltransferase involved in cell wall biosynthesis
MRKKGWKVWGVSAGVEAARTFDGDFADEFTTVLAPESVKLVEHVHAFLQFVEQYKINIVIPMAQKFIHAAARHLPRDVRVCVRVASITRGTYAVAAAHKERASRTLVASPRQAADLHRYWGYAARSIRLIPHGISLSRFGKIQRRCCASQHLSVGYLGRLEDQDKGVMFLPGLFAHVLERNPQIRLHVIGDGPSRSQLTHAMRKQGLDGRVNLPGKVSPNEVPSVLAAFDVLVMPSRFEGFGFALLEAMVAGCVPVASHIRGASDFIIEDGVSGFLCPIGDTKAFADAILRLDRDRDLLTRMSAAARKRVEERFTLERMIEGYDQALSEVLVEPPLDITPHPLTDIALPPLLRPTWRTRVPQPLKNFVRKWTERLWGRAC